MEHVVAKSGIYLLGGPKSNINLMEVSSKNFKWISSSFASIAECLEGCFSHSILGDLGGCSLEVDASTLEPKSILFSELPTSSSSSFYFIFYFIFLFFYFFLIFI